MGKQVEAEAKMVKAVKELESGIPAETIARDYTIAQGTLYNRKSKCSEMDVSKIKKRKELEDDNRRLKPMYANLAIDDKILKDIIEKNSRARAQKRVVIENDGRILNQYLSDVQIDDISQIPLLL